MNSIYKQKAKDFLEQYNIKNLSLKQIKNIIELQGYNIVYLNVPENHLVVQELLEVIGCEEYAKVSKAFTYKNASNKIIFVDGNLQENDMLRVLAHEEGQIFCGHMERMNCSFAVIEDEWEANEFAHYIFDPPMSYKMKMLFKTNRKYFLIAIY